ncbi:hypothetical protein [Massilia sp. Root418]|jgi:hypothetical protein|uniref:hypothetical protein n=1 Tax=Massilia sp. Root418 TaxID=1736532 RepID=UPI000AC25789|nr:hypothetical protein [Massilia sp. Root418]
MAIKKKNSDKPYSGFILTFEPARTEWLAERVQSGKQISESFSALDVSFERRELVALVLNKNPFSINALALMEKMHGSGGAGKIKMRMSEILPFPAPVTHFELSNLHFELKPCTPETLLRSEPIQWSEFVDTLCRLRPEMQERITEMVARRNMRPYLAGNSDKIDRLNEQRDGLGLSLDIAQIDRAAILKSLNPDKIPKANSIFDLLDNLPIAERSLLEHDAPIIKKLLGTESVKSAHFSEAGRSVRVHITDQTPLESVLGIDLLIYSTCYNNFLLLQYKKMQKRVKGWAYTASPTSNIHAQLESMRNFHETVNNEPVQDTNLWSYRLNNAPFYFKFCEQLNIDARDDSLIPGITLSEPHLREFLSLPAAKEDGQTLTIGHQNCPRYLNNSEFIQLARVGWIGSDARATNLIRKLLEENEKGGRRAMLAIIDIPQTKEASSRGKKK